MARLTMIAVALVLSLGAPRADTAAQNGPLIDHAWARATPGSARTSAAYFRIESPTDDRLISLETQAARKAELHTHVQQGNVMQMREVEGGVRLRANEVLQLEPGGLLHVMLIDLNTPLKAGDRFPLISTLANSGETPIISAV